MDILQTLSADLAFDVRMGQTAFGGYAPAAQVLATRIYGKAEDALKALLKIDGPASEVWMERASEHKGRTYHVGHRKFSGAAYDAELERIRDLLKAAGYKTRLNPRHPVSGYAPALYVTLDPKLGEDAVAAHLDYLRLLSQQEGVYLPGWAKDLIAA